MRTILVIINKEFRQILRNKAIFPLIIGVPILQLIILVNAATFEMNGNSVDVIIHIPAGFEKKLYRENTSDLQLIINAINGVAAGLVNAYTSRIISDFNREIVIKYNRDINTSPVDITYTHWYNPELNYKTFMVPGILVLLVTLVGLILTCLNIVREKEMGTIEQINVTPIKKYHFITGKLFPFWVIALLEMALGLTIGKLLYHIPIVGSLWLVFLMTAVYMLVILGIGLFVSTISNTQQQAIFISFFFLIIFILMSGLFTAIENMPEWAQWLTKINPVAYFIRALRMILLKGSGFTDISTEFFSLLIFGITMLGLSVWRYRKVA